MAKLTTMLGWGLAKEAGEKIKGRKKQIDTALNKALGKTKGTFKPKGKKYK